jgi:hypothetical protein
LDQTTFTKNVQVTEKAFSSQKRPSNDPTLQNMNFKKKFYLWVIFALLIRIPDPLTRLNPDPIRIRNPGFRCINLPGQNDNPIVGTSDFDAQMSGIMTLNAPPPFRILNGGGRINARAFENQHRFV